MFDTLGLFCYNIFVNLTNTEIKQFKDKKFRKQNGLFMVEGNKFCKDLLSTDIEILYTITNDKDLIGFPNICVVSERMLAQLTTTVTNQSIVCICKTKDVPLPAITNSLILDNLQDPGNVGTLIRSAVAFGFCDVYLIGGADVYSEKVIRSSAGTILKCRLHVCDFNTIKRHKKEIADCFIVADMCGENIKNVEINGKIAVIVGNEGQGVSDEFMTIADKTVSIPMMPSVESLNAGVAGSIIMEKLGELNYVRS